jgi:hypothetical protein
MKLTNEEHLAMLKKAIAANLAARVKHDIRQERDARGKAVEFKLICAAELMEADEDALYLESVIEDPIRKALRKQLKDLGWRLFRLLGNTDRMLEVAEEISNMKPGSWQYRIDIFDKTWDGIGVGHDFWVS